MIERGLTVHLMTRGVSADYAFVGGERVEPWWSDLAAWTRVEKPTLVIRSGRFFVSGIESAARRDRTGTIIRYALAGEVTDRDGVVPSVNLVSVALAQVVASGGMRDFGRSLDAIGNDLLEASIASSSPGADRPTHIAAGAEVRARVTDLLFALPESHTDGAERPSRWVGGLTDECAQAFLQRAAALLAAAAGSPGVAALLNLLDADPQRAKRAAQQFAPHHELALLVPGGPSRPFGLARPELRTAGLAVATILVALVVGFLTCAGTPSVSHKSTNPADSTIRTSSAR